VQGRDRLYVKFVAEQLGLDGSYIPRTYIEQIQLEKLINDVMVCILLVMHLHSIFTLLQVVLLSHWLSLTDMQALPDDLKTKLSIDDELVSSPKEAFSRVSADKRNKLMKRFLNRILVSILNCCSCKVELSVET
jgi:hypothetical protein